MSGRYPATPGFKERTTSQDAARAIASRAPLLRDRVLAEIARIPGTADEIAHALGESVLSVRPRLSELRRMGLIEQTGRRRKNKSGQNAAEWCVIARAVAA